MALSDILISGWSFEQSSGDIIDSIDSNNGTNYGVTRGSTGKIDNGIDLASSEYIDIPYNSNFNITDVLSIEAWIKTTGTGNYQTIICHPYQNTSHSSPYYRYTLLVTDSGYADFFVGLYGNREIIGTTDITDGNWHHIVGTYNTNTDTLRIYVDGTKEGETTSAGTMLSGTTVLRIGENGGYGEQFVGSLDEIRLYHGELTQTDVDYLYNSGNGRSLSEIIGTTPSIISVDITTGSTLDIEATVIGIISVDITTGSILDVSLFAQSLLSANITTGSTLSVDIYAIKIISVDISTGSSLDVDITTGGTPSSLTVDIITGTILKVIPETLLSVDINSFSWLDVNLAIEKQISADIETKSELYVTISDVGSNSARFASIPGCLNIPAGYSIKRKDDDSGFESFNISSLIVTHRYSIEKSGEFVQLVGDEQTPGNSKLYGTNSSGVRGWYDIPTSGTPTAHHTTHENGGSDEINVAGLSGVLADAQNPISHHSSHENGGTDEINVQGLSGVLADAQTPAAHSHNWMDISDRPSFINSILLNSGNVSLVNDSASPGNDKVYGTNSSGVKGWRDFPSGGITYTFQYSLNESSAVVNLVNDVASPGNSKLYGTNSSGVRGWYDIPTSGTPTAHHTTHELGGSDELQGFVHTTTNESIAGIKDFTTAIKITGTGKSAGQFYAGTTDPTNTTRLNYDGYFYSVRFYSDQIYIGGVRKDSNWDTAYSKAHDRSHSMTSSNDHQNISANVIIGRISTSGTPQELTAANVRSIINVADGANNYTHPNHFGDVTSDGDGATTISNQAVTNTKFRNSGAYSIIGRSESTSGSVHDIVAGTDTVLRRVGSGDLTWGQIVNNMYATASITYSKIQNVTADRILGRLSTSGTIQELSSSQVLSFLGISGTGEANTITSNILYAHKSGVGLYVDAYSSLTIGKLSLTTSNPSDVSNTLVFNGLFKASRLYEGGTRVMNQSHVANNITSTNISNWNSKYSSTGGLIAGSVIINGSEYLRDQLIFAITDAQTSGNFRFKLKYGNDSYTMNGNYGWYIEDYVNSETKVFIEAGANGRINLYGSVNIGMNTGTYKLNVNGEIYANQYVKTNRLGLVGTYSSSTVQGIWSIAEGYLISTANNDFGDTYGIVYAYENVGTGALGSKKPLSGFGHGIYFTYNGTTKIGFSLSYGHINMSGNLIVGGTITASGLLSGTDFALSSDIKIKCNIKRFTGVEKAMSLKPVTYEYKDKTLGEGIFHGFIAQDILKAGINDLVSKNALGIYSVSYSRITSINTAAIQDHNKKIANLQSEIKKLKSEINILKKCH